MIVRDQPSALRLFFVVQGSVLPSILGKVLAVSALSILVLIVDRYVVTLLHVSFSAMSVFGIALSLFLGFRNNAAYERWWEARKLWGSIIADVRNLGRVATIFVGSPLERERLLNLGVVFAHLHRGWLRGSAVTDEIAGWLEADVAQRLSATQNPADAALRDVAEHVGALHRQGAISDFGQIAFSKVLASLGSAQASCERIATTPLPFVYSLLVRRTTYIYCLLLPFALIETTGWLTPLFAAIVAYVFFGLQTVTNELERPFLPAQNGLPLDAMCRAIEISVAEATGREPPAPLVAENHVLN